MTETFQFDRRPGLRQAIDHLYVVFSRYSLPAEMWRCPCCTTEADEAVLRRSPLRILTTGDLEKFARKAMTTFGTVHDFKHFLPRWLEIVAHEGCIGDLAFELLCSKLDFGKWGDWDNREQQAIRDYFHGLWRHLLEIEITKGLPIWTASRFLSGIAETREDIRPYLCDWISDSRPRPVHHLANFIVEELPGLMRPGAKGGWSGDRPEAVEQIVEWLRSNELAAHLETMFFEYAGTASADTLSLAFEYVTWARNNQRQA